jgi:hypothetical protein
MLAGKGQELDEGLYGSLFRNGGLGHGHRRIAAGLDSLGLERLELHVAVFQGHL